MAANRTERLLNLVIALLATKRWLTKEHIRDAVPQYADCESAEAFDRMFERDKDDLRELGIPVLVGSADAWFDDEVGYRIDREQYALPPIEVTAAELAAVAVASQVWQQASWAAPAARAVTKLKALGEGGDSEPWAISPRIGATEATFDPLYQAITARRAVSFEYHKADGSRRRSVQPWSLTSRYGRWYLIGYDTDRQARRAFRLSRIAGAVRAVGAAGGYDIPSDIDAAALVQPPRAEADGRSATIALRRGRGELLRRSEQASITPGEGGWDELSLPIIDIPMLAQHLADLGSDARALEPADLRDAVRALLRDAAAATAVGGNSLAAPSEPTTVESVAVDKTTSGSATQAPDSDAAPTKTQPDTPRAPRTTIEPATARLSRLLAMVPYLLAHPGQHLAAVASHFGISQPQLVKDLELLFVCGTPGHLPDDLIEAEWESGHVYLRNADAIARPLRLGFDEAVATIVGLRAVLELSGRHDAATASVLAKLSAAAGDACAAADQISVSLGESVPDQVLATIQQALAQQRRLEVEYVVASRDEVTQRQVDPHRIFNVASRWYVEGWCYRAAEVRTFRLDRITACGLTDTPIDPAHRAARSGKGSGAQLARQASGGSPATTPAQLFRPTTQDVPITARIAASARWLVEYIPCETVTDHSDGGLVVTMQVARPEWLVRLALRLGGKLQVLEPPDVASQIRQRAEAALAGYPLDTDIPA